MKKNLIALAVSAAILAPTVSFAEMEWYGRLDVSLDMKEKEVGGTSTIDNWQLNSHSSRLGIKGSQELENGMHVIGQAEYEIAIDDGDEVFKQRPIFLGLKGHWGKLTAGKQDTPSKKVQGKNDHFGDHAADFKKIITAEARPSNAIQYTSPKIAESIVAKVMLVPGEESGDDADDGIADGSSVSVQYFGGPFYAGLAFDSSIANNNSGLVGDVVGKDGETGSPNILGSETASGIKMSDRTLIAGGFKGDGFTVGLVYEMAQADTDDTGGVDVEQNSLLLSGLVKVGKTGFKAVYGQAEAEVAGVTVADGDIFAIGVEQYLAKKTKVYAEYTAESEDESDSDLTTFAFGMQHKF